MKKSGVQPLVKYVVNIEETIDIKVAALRAHKSQMKDWDPEERIKE